MEVVQFTDFSTCKILHWSVVSSFEHYQLTCALQHTPGLLLALVGAQTRLYFIGIKHTAPR